MPYIDSTTISWLDYDPQARTLSVRFHAAPVLYIYSDVPEDVYEAFLEAPSKIAFLREQIEPVSRVDTQPLNQAGEISQNTLSA